MSKKKRSATRQKRQRTCASRLEDESHREPLQRKDCWSMTEAARFLNCKPEVVSRLAERGYFGPTYRYEGDYRLRLVARERVMSFHRFTPLERERVIPREIEELERPHEVTL